MSNYERVLAALRRVAEEAKSWRSNDGETLADWQERRTLLTAQRLYQLILECPKCLNDLTVMCPVCNNDE